MKLGDSFGVGESLINGQARNLECLILRGSLINGI